MPPSEKHVLVRQLDDVVQRLDMDRARQSSLQHALVEGRRELRRARVGAGLCRLKRLLRMPARSYHLWPMGVMLVGPLLIASFWAVVVLMLFDSFSFGAIVFAITAFVAAAGFGTLMYSPNDEQLSAQSDLATTRLAIAGSRADDIAFELNGVTRNILANEQVRDEILSSRRHQQELLLAENWKAMRGAEWETFLARAFHLLGGMVETTGTVGDQGVDLVVEFPPHRFAIQSKAYIKSVGNDAVQQAVAGMAHYRCDRCAVITNSDFTAGAIALAKSNQCLLVGERHVPAFVLGDMPWFNRAE